MATTKPTTIAATWIFTATLLLLSLPMKAQSPVGSPVAAEMPSSGMTAPSPGPDCFSALLNMSDCLSYVVAGNNLTKPDKKCCPELAGLVDSQPICLCQLLGNPGSTGIEIDMSKALNLPKVCKVSTPPPSICAAFGVPVGAPTTANEPAASSSPSPSPSPAGLAASSPASVNSDKNGVPSSRASLLCFLAGLLTTIIISIHFH